MIPRRALVLCLLALGLGGFGAVLNYRWLQARAAAEATRVVEKEPETVPVVVAKTSIGVGSPLREAQLGSVAWPVNFAPQGSFRSAAELIHRVPRRTLGAGEPVLESALLPAGSAAGLSPIIASGKRAVAVRVDEVVGIAGFIQPGAMVDVLATIHERSGSSASSFSKVILQGVKVLAIDQTLERQGEADPKLVNVVTLEVTPPDAQKLTYAAHEGKLQLALRNPGDLGEVATTSIGANHLRGVVRTPRPVRPPGPQMQMIKGMNVSNQSF